MVLKNRIKILHVLGGLDAGGVETWLYNIVAIQNFWSEYQIDFIVFSGETGVYGEDLKRLGCRIYCIPKSKNPIKLSVLFLKIIWKNKYDIIHSHRHYLNSLYLFLSLFSKSNFISHSHNTSTDSKIFNIPIIRFLFHGFGKLAKYKLACTVEAAKAIFDNDTVKVIQYGINTTFFEPKTNKSIELLSELNIPPEKKIVGHVGRFTEQKNHGFLLDIAKELIAMDDSFIFICIGEGVLFESIKSRIEKEGLSRNVYLLGIRRDVDNFMSSIFDFYLFPSMYEGLGIVLLEAQCAGLPVFFTNTLPSMVDQIPNLIHRLQLSHSPKVWAQEIFKCERLSLNSRLSYYELFKSTQFTIQHSASILKEYYENIITL